MEISLNIRAHKIRKQIQMNSKVNSNNNKIGKYHGLTLEVSLQRF
jgi:hypothetical protein